jgi:hypothetical protein
MIANLKVEKKLNKLARVKLVEYFINEINVNAKFNLYYIVPTFNTFMIKMMILSKKCKKKYSPHPLHLFCLLV